MSGLVPVGSFGGARYDPIHRLEGRRLGERTTEDNASAWGRFKAALKDKEIEYL